MFQDTPETKQTLDWLTFILDLIKILAPIATLIISIINLRYALWMFRYKNQREDEDKDRGRQIDWFKKLVLDHNLSQFYGFFENLEVECKKLNDDNCSLEVKKQIESANLEQQIILRRNFIETLSIVDESLYDYTLEKIDTLIENMNGSIFNQGINLTHKPMFEDKILIPISETRKDILKRMFEYRGENTKLLKS